MLLDLATKPLALFILRKWLYILLSKRRHVSVRFHFLARSCGTDVQNFDAENHLEPCSSQKLPPSNSIMRYYGKDGNKSIVILVVRIFTNNEFVKPPFNSDVSL